MHLKTADKNSQNDLLCLNDGFFVFVWGVTFFAE
jgi:hypothetical protein